MSDDTTKVESSEKPDPEVLNTDDIDQLIAQTDPNFSNQLNDFKATDFPDQLPDEQESPKEYTRAQLVWNSLIQKFHNLKYKFIHWILIKLPQFLIYIRDKIKSFFDSISEGLRQFKYADKQHKKIVIAYSFFALVSILASTFILWKGFIPAQEELFLTSLKSLSDKVVTYDSNQDLEPFYDSPHLNPYIVEIPKMIVNLIASENSGPRPMIAVDFFVEGLSNDVLVEVKDRMPEIRDLCLRKLEDMTYDQLSSQEGKLQLSDQLRKSLNKTLTQGQIRRVMLKTIILKP